MQFYCKLIHGFRFNPFLSSNPFPTAFALIFAFSANLDQSIDPKSKHIDRFGIHGRAREVSEGGREGGRKN